MRLIGLLLLLAAAVLPAQESITVLPAPIAWDAVTELVDGTPISGVRYEILVARWPGLGDEQVFGPTSTDAPLYSILVSMISGCGDWAVGVRALWSNPAGDTLRSAITWSTSLDLAAVPQPFFVSVPCAVPMAPIGLRLR